MARNMLLKYLWESKGSEDGCVAKMGMFSDNYYYRQMCIDEQVQDANFDFAKYGNLETLYWLAGPSVQNLQGFMSICKPRRYILAPLR